MSDANLQVNYRQLPYGLGHGLRLGTSFSAMAGLTTVHVEELSDVLEEVLTGGNPETMRDRVRDLARQASKTTRLDQIA